MAFFGEAYTSSWHRKRERYPSWSFLGIHTMHDMSLLLSGKTREVDMQPGWAETRPERLFLIAVFILSLDQIIYPVIFQRGKSRLGIPKM